MKPIFRTRSRDRQARWFLLLTLPWLIGALFFHILPILAAGVLSFMDWRPPMPPTWTGMTHLNTAATDALLWRTLRNSAVYAAGSVPATVILGLILALLVDHRRQVSRFFPAIYFLPAAISGVATTLMWAWIFNPRYGLVNLALVRVGLQGPAWLQDERWAMPAMILIALWSAGSSTLVYLGALQNIPAELKEAAVLDGATWLKVLQCIVWPLISPATLYLFVANTIGSFQVFTPFYLLTQGGPDFSTLTLPLYIYLNAFSWGKMGYAALLALILFCVVFVLTAIQFRVAGRWVFYLGYSRH